MNAERLFWMTREFIKDKLAEMSDEDIIAIEHTLPEDAVLAFDIDEILEGFSRFPQCLINLKVDNANEVIMNNSFRAALKNIEASLGDLGRVLIRPSGTEPLIRIMVESKKAGVADESARLLADVATSIYK